MLLFWLLLLKIFLYVEEKTSKYNNNLWFKIYEKVNLFKVYEDLFKLFDTEKINYRVLFSSNKSFKITDRVFVHHNLLGKYFELPNKDQVSDLMKKRIINLLSYLTIINLIVVMVIYLKIEIIVFCHYWIRIFEINQF